MQIKCNKSLKGNVGRLRKYKFYGSFLLLILERFHNDSLFPLTKTKHTTHQLPLKTWNKLRNQLRFAEKVNTI